MRKACGGEEVKFRGVGGECMVGLVVGVEVEVGVGVEVEGEVGWGVVLGWEGKGVVVMLRAEAVAEDCAVREGKAEVVDVEEGVVEAGLE